MEFPNVRFRDNGKLKLLILVGTRPEIIRLSAVIKKCRRYFDTILAHTGQNYDYTLSGIFFRDLIHLRIRQLQIWMRSVPIWGKPWAISSPDRIV